MGLGSVLLIEILSDGGDLASLEIGELDGAPALGGADHGAEHQLEHGPRAESVGDDLQTATLLDEEALEEIRGPDRAAACHGHAQMGDAGFEVVLEAGDGRGVRAEAAALKEAVADLHAREPAAQNLWPAPSARG